MLEVTRLILRNFWTLHVHEDVFVFSLVEKCRVSIKSPRATFPQIQG